MDIKLIMHKYYTSLVIIFLPIIASESANDPLSQDSRPDCHYGPRGSLTAICENATPDIFNVTSYKFNMLDETLKCVNCNFSEIKTGTFDINQNRIKTLNISNSNIEIVNKKAFLGLMFMETLIMSNNHISNLQPGAFIGVRNIKYIDLQNAISSSSLEEEVFKELRLLQELNLKYNNLISLKTRTFYGLENLKVLDLSNNKLKAINNAFQFIPNVEYINLQNNELADLNDDEFYGLNALLYLNLADNFIGNFTMKIHPLNNLKFLDLSNNHLGNQAVASGTFKNMHKLEYLNLSSNWFKSIPPKFLEGLYNLHDLNLHNNQISFFQTGTFSGLPSLRYLNLSHNNIYSANITGRLILAELHSLDLSNNKIKDIDYYSFILKAPKIVFVNLMNNPLSCELQVQLNSFSKRDIKFGLSNNESECKGTTIPTAQELERKLEEKMHPHQSSTTEIIMFVFVMTTLVLVGILYYIQFNIIQRVNLHWRQFLHVNL